jgi:uncharacterized repeat protein (TIGR04076 family)
MGKLYYGITLEIFEGGGCEIHKVGQKFNYPDDTGKLCPWLLDSLNSMVRVLQFGGTLPWAYRGTPYEKGIDPRGAATEFVRCPDPTSSGVVVKITRIRLDESKEVGWA